MKNSDSSFLYINSIYIAHEGEGQFIGVPQFFVRLQGCAVGCTNCDSKDTWAFNRGGEHLSLAEISGKLKELNSQLKRVSITGGDPTDARFEESLLALIKLLKSEGYWINMEASGTRLSYPLFDLLDWISLDLKTPSTGVEGDLNLIGECNDKFMHKMQIKSVVQDEKDFLYVRGSYSKLLETRDSLAPWVLTPSYQSEDAGDNFQALVQQLYQWNYSSGTCFRIIGQQHKWIFGPNQKQV